MLQKVVFDFHSKQHSSKTRHSCALWRMEFDYHSKQHSSKTEEATE